jgi:signal transduction histidine kinase
VRALGQDTVVSVGRLLLGALARDRSEASSLGQLRSDLSHETSAKMARIISLVSEWHGGRFLPQDPFDAIEILDDLDAIFSRYARLASARPTTFWGLGQVLACLRSARRQLRGAIHEQALSLKWRERLSASLDRLRIETSSLVEGLSRPHGIRLAAVVAEATGEIRREVQRAAGQGAAPILLEGTGDTGGAWVPRGDAAQWRDLFRNFVRNGVQACEEKPRTEGAERPSVSVRMRPLTGGDGMAVEIADEGVGMSPDQLDTMWRGGVSRNGAGRGRGLTEAKLDFLMSRATCEVRSVPLVGTALRVEVSDRAIAIPAVSFLKTFPAQLLLLLAALLIGAGVAGSRRSEIISFEGDGGSLIRGRDADGNVAWERDLDERVLENAVDPKTGNPQYRTAVLRGPDHNVLGTVIPTQPDVGPGRLWFLDPQGRTRRIRTLAWHSPLNDKLGKLVPIYEAVVSWNRTVGNAVAVQVRDVRYAPSCTQFFSAEGESLGAYYHSGHLEYRLTGDLDNDARQEILLTGINNPAQYDKELFPRDPEAYIDCLVVLEIPDVNGQSYPYTRWSEIPPADEEAYILFPPLIHGERARIFLVEVGSSGGDGLPRIQVTLVDGRIYHLDAHFRPVSCSAGDLTMAARIAPTRPIAPIVYFRHGRRELLDIPIP